MAPLSALALLALCGCRAAAPAALAPADGPSARLASAESRARGEPRDAALLARLGWLRWLVGSDPAAAAEAFSRARQLTGPGGDAGGAAGGGVPGLALALAGDGELLDERLDGLGAAQAFLAALRADRSGPIGEFAAHRLLELEGESAAIDDQVLAAAALAGPGTPGRTALLLREGRARVLHGRALATLAVPGGTGPAPAEELEGVLAETAAWAEAGAVQRVRVAGPYAASRLLSLSEPTPLDGPALARAPAAGPAGPTGERTLDFPDGDIGLDDEPYEGDLYYAASQLSVGRGGDYLLRLEGAGALEARLDAEVVLSRSPWPVESPRSEVRPVRLAAGEHALLVRWTRAEGQRFRVVVARADGAPSDVRSRAPAELWGQRKPSLCALGGSCSAPAPFAAPTGLRAAAESELRSDPGDPLAAFLLATVTRPDDRAAGMAAIALLVATSGGGAPALALRALSTLRDPELPERIGRARAQADLRAALAKAPGALRLRLLAAGLDRDADRPDDAADELDRAEARLGAPPDARLGAGPDAPRPARLLVAQARLLAGRGNTPRARMLLEQALRSGDRCDALAPLFELLQRDADLPAQRARTGALLACPDQRSALAGFWRSSGDLAAHRSLLAGLAALRPAQPGRLLQLAEAKAASEGPAAALPLLGAAAALSPRSPEPSRRRAALLDALGDGPGALQARREALALAPGDLQLRLAIARAEGVRLLSFADRDGAQLARTATSTLPDGQERPSALRLLDQGAVEIGPDGSGVELVRLVTRVLDKRGIGKVGEAHVPSDAEVLELRTLKPDGRSLEPEAIPEKESHSLPGLEPGDAVEVSYLRALPRRGPELPGLSPGPFYFEDEETAMLESTYEVRAAPNVPLELDQQGLPPVPLERTEAGFRVRYTARDVPMELPERGQPSETELAPWLQVGWGARPSAQARSLADWSLLRSRSGEAVRELARAIRPGPLLSVVEQVAQAAARAVRGRSLGADFSAPATHVLAQGRGNRLLVLQAVLRELGIGSHLLLVRPFSAPQRDLRFPRSDLFTAAVLRVDPVGLPPGSSPGSPPAGTPIWVDASLRFSPVGYLPPGLRGQPAWILPQPGEADALEVAPPGAPADAELRSYRLELALDVSGAARGSGRDEQRGFAAAGLREALERLSVEQRRQAVEGMLGRSARGVRLERLEVLGEEDPGGPAALRFQLALQLGRPEGGGLRLPASSLPQQLARRFLQKAERRRPLLLDGDEQVEVRVDVALPAGFHLRAPPPPVALDTPFGHYRWQAEEHAGHLLVQERFDLPLARVPVAAAPDFAAFARAVDRAQERELEVGRE
jgi:hypothetical protein